MRKHSVLTLLSTLAICTPIFAQQAPDQPQGSPPDMQGPPHGGPEQFAERMLDRVKHELSASDEEWTSISPKIKTILALEHELYAGGGGPPPPPRDDDHDGGPPDGQPGADAGGGPNVAPDKKGNAADAPPEMQSNTDSSEADALHKAKRALGNVVHQSDANADDLVSALKTIRSARSAARTALSNAQAGLKPMVNSKQEAVLVAFGILE